MSRRPWTVLVLLSIAQFMVILDVTVVNVALPSIGRDLNFAPSDLQWVVSAYVLLTGGLLLIGGRAADVLGRRPVFLTGLAIFTTASLMSGLAASPEWLIVSRGAQGLGAAMLTPGALSIITTTYAGEQRTGALAVWGAIGGAGAAVGVVLGGILTSWLGWESVFFINVPIGIAVALLTLRIVPSSGPATSDRRLGVPGAVSVVVGLVLLVYAIQGTSQHGWGSARTLVPLAVSALLLASFALIERRAARPLVPPAMWRNRSLVAGVTLMFGATGILVGTFFLNTLYLQHELGFSALETGFAFLPISVLIGFGAHSAQHLMGRIGTRAVAVVGLALIAVGALILAAAPDHAGYATELLPGFLVLALGIGLVFPTASVTTMNDVDHRRAGLASGLMTTGHEIGAALGVATFSAIATAGDTFSVGYGNGFVIAAIVSAVMALVALVTVPAVRPAGGASVPVH